jgi:hypothetical protein
MKVIKQVPTQDFDIVITLGRYEASVLLKVLNNVGGDPHHSPRVVTDELKKRLENLGVYPVGVEMTGGSHFKNG